MIFGKCKGCEILKQENAYLRRFIDSLLSKLGMIKVEATQEKAPEVKEPEGVKLGPQGEKFGDLD